MTRTTVRRMAAAALAAGGAILAASAYAATAHGWTATDTAIVCRHDGHVLRFDATADAHETRVHVTSIGMPNEDPTAAYSCSVVGGA